jgi:hypothetical protein
MHLHSPNSQGFIRVKLCVEASVHVCASVELLGVDRDEVFLVTCVAK